MTTPKAVARGTNPPRSGAPANRVPPRKFRKTSLRIKFGLSITLLITVTIVAISYFTLQGEKTALKNEMEERGRTIAVNMAVNASKPLFNQDKITLSGFAKDAMQNQGVLYAFIIDESKMYLAHNDMERVKRSEIYQPPLGVTPLGNEKTVVSPPIPYGKEKVTDIAVPILLNNDTKLGEVHIGLSQTRIEATINQALRELTQLAVIFIIFGILVAIILVAIIIRPIKALEAGAQLIGRGNLDYVIPVRSNDEIGNLARSFNRMTTDLKSAQKNLIEKEKMEQELETARKIQAVLLPKEEPVIPGYTIVAYYRSAKEVGGDYYDFHRISDQLLGLAVADVSGKGVPGSLGMVMTRSILRSQVYLADAFQILTRTNGLLFKDIKRGMFVTMFYALLDVNKKTLNCANAGHNPLLLAHHNGTVERFNPSGIALGLDKGERFNNKLQAVNIRLKPGDTFVLYTDGITEAMNAANEEFTEERLAEVVGKNAHLSARDLTDKIVGELTAFAAGAPQHDDITMLTVKVL